LASRPPARARAGRGGGEATTATPTAPPAPATTQPAKPAIPPPPEGLDPELRQRLLDLAKSLKDLEETSRRALEELKKLRGA